MADLHFLMEEVFTLSELVEKNESRYAEQLHQSLQKMKKQQTKSCNCCQALEDITILNDTFKNLLKFDEFKDAFERGRAQQ